MAAATSDFCSVRRLFDCATSQALEVNSAMKTGDAIKRRQSSTLVSDQLGTPVLTLATLAEQDGHLGADHFDLRVTLHNLFDPGQRECKVLELVLAPVRRVLTATATILLCRRPTLGASFGEVHLSCPELDQQCFQRPSFVL